MKVVFFILLGLFILLLFGLFFKMKFKLLLLFHLKNKSAYYSLNHKFLSSLIQGKLIVLEDGKISIMVKKNMILSKETQEGFGEVFFKEILKKMKLQRLDVYIDQGKFSDEMTTALLSGGARTIAGVVASYLKNNEIETDFHFLTTENKNELSIAVNTNIKISAFSGLVAYVKTKKQLKLLEEKKKEYAKV